VNNITFRKEASNGVDKIYANI